MSRSILVVLLVPSILWGCYKHGDHSPWFATVPAKTVYTTPGGLHWEPYGPIPSNYPGPDPQPDDLRWTNTDEIGTTLDGRVDTFAKANPSLGVWAMARQIRWCIVDDYCFPDGGADDSTTGFASGETAHNSPPWVVLALWTRHHGAMDPGATIAPWCKRTPIQGIPEWRWGDYPMLPAVGYELGNVFYLRPQKPGPAVAVPMDIHSEDF